VSGAGVRAQENPFRTERLDRLGFRAAATGAPADLDSLVERFERLGRRAAVIGPEGSGKTTLLDALEPRFAARGLIVRRLRAAPGGGALWEQPPVKGARWSRPPARSALSKSTAFEGTDERTLLVVDGLDRLPFASRRRIRQAGRQAAGLLVTAHRRLRLPTLIECATTPALLAALIADLGADLDRDFGGAASHALHRRHRGNLRTALLELYDRYAGR